MLVALVVLVGVEVTLRRRWRLMSCLFCDIAAGDGARRTLVLADDDFVAFLDTRPVFKGHVLLVPRAHVVTLPDLPAGLRDGFLARHAAAGRRDGRRAGRRRDPSWR